MTHEELLKLVNQIRSNERLRISNWIKENRKYIEIDAGIGIYRDLFDSTKLLEFINEEDSKSV